MKNPCRKSVVTENKAQEINAEIRHNDFNYDNAPTKHILKKILNSYMNLVHKRKVE